MKLRSDELDRRAAALEQLVDTTQPNAAASDGGRHLHYHEAAPPASPTPPAQPTQVIVQGPRFVMAAPAARARRRSAFGTAFGAVIGISTGLLFVAAALIGGLILLARYNRPPASNPTMPPAATAAPAARAASDVSTDPFAEPRAVVEASRAAHEAADAAARSLLTARGKVDAAQRTMAAARQKALAPIRANAEYVKIGESLDRLEEAKKVGSNDQRLAAAHDWLVTRQRLTAFEAESLDRDVNVIAATQALASAEAEFREATTRAQAAQRAAEKRDADDTPASGFLNR
jgi:hypothetical protein